jgi:hypothetical protein
MAAVRSLLGLYWPTDCPELACNLEAAMGMSQCAEVDISLRCGIYKFFRSPYMGMIVIPIAAGFKTIGYKGMKKPV